MSVIIRLQNLPWSANALDIRNYFRGLSIPEGGVHIVGGELGDAFIAFSTDEDARQAMMLDGGKIKEIQVKLLLSSRSEMHKVIEAARQTVPILSLAPTVAPSAPAPVPVPVPVNLPTPVPQPTPPVITPFSSVLGSSGLSNFGIPGLGNPQEIPQPAVIEPPALLISPQSKTPEEEETDDKSETKRNKDRRRSRSHSRSRDRDRKDRKRDRRDRSRSRERRRRDRSRSRERRDRKRDRKDRSRSRERSPRRARDKRNDRRSPMSSQERTTGDKVNDIAPALLPMYGNSMNLAHNNGQQQIGLPANSPLLNGPVGQPSPQGNQGRFSDPALKEAFNKLQELGKKRNPNAFQGDQNNSGGGRPMPGRGGNNNARGGGNLRRDGRQSRFDDAPVANCCVAIRNAPNHTSYGDVRRFFPFMIDKHGIKMINDNTGCRTGSIFVRFCDPRSKQLALQKQPNELKGSIVVVESLEDELYDSAVDSYLPFRDDNDEEEHLSSNIDTDNRRPLFKFSVLKLADLPNFVKEHDIMKAFSDFSLLSILLNDCRVTRTKIAFVQFVKPDDARKALESKESYLFGRRQPIITPVTDEEYENEKMSNDKMEPQINRLMNNEPAPEPAVPRDPRQRRQQNDNGPGSNPSNIQGQPPYFPPNGPFPQNFNVPFGNPQFAAYPSGNMDPRTAAATWANRPPFPKKKEAARGPPAMNPQIINLDMDDEPLECVLMKGLPREATDRTILDFLSDTGAVPARIHLMLDGHGRPSGDCFCEFRTPEEARQAVTKHGHNLDGNRVTVDLVMRSVVEEALEGPKTEPKRDMIGNPALMNTPNNNGPPAQQFFDSPRDNFSGRGAFRGRGGFQRGNFDRGGFNRGGFDQSRGNFRGRGNWNDRGRGFDRGRGRGFGRGRGGFDGGRDQMRNEEEDPGLEDFGAPGCVVSLENVPFRASVDDILNFFRDFELTQDDVIRRYNERGQPTGDARVAFASPAHAQRAVATRNMNTIFERRVSLSLL